MLPIYSLKKDVNCLICHSAVVQQEVNTEIMADYGEQQNVHHSYWDGKRLHVSFNIFPSCVCSFLSPPPQFFSSLLFVGFFLHFFLSLSCLFLLFPCLLSSFLACFNTSCVLLQPNVLGKVLDFYSLTVV